MIEIKPIQPHQTEEVKTLIFSVVQEIWQLTEQEIKKVDDMTDIDHVRSQYFNNKGIFLVLCDDSKIVGSGGIRRLSDDICELKRMWFRQDYRGRGLGKQMSQKLLEFAKATGYTKIRLDVFDKQKQSQSIKFYQKLGFYLIDKYNESPCDLFMEKLLIW
ncbi:GNAT family N-acetyltransferase [Nostoc sp. CCY0012]|uniref:GNAT family N-acetyltransferase n=1 Tax=Nostoc sp. CCY0012 TaxID=1056123 RepID=UPI0039C5DED9